MAGGRGGGQSAMDDGEVNRCVGMIGTWGLEWLLILIEDPSDTEEDKGQVSQGSGGRDAGIGTKVCCHYHSLE